MCDSSDNAPVTNGDGGIIYLGGQGHARFVPD